MKIKLGGKTYEVGNVNLNHLIEIEEKHGSLSQFKSGIPLKVIRTFAYAVLKEFEPEITEEKIGKMLNPNDAETLKQFVDLLSQPVAKSGDKIPLASA